MDDFIDNLAYRFFLVIDPDIEDEIIFFSRIVPMSYLILILVVSFIDGFLRDESGELESVLGMFVEHVDIEIEQKDKRNIDQQISASRYAEESTELVQ